tara:strand:+ start:434 stop:1264 length:831 start_codon:yes stop_codon:yes gene_type:complete
MATKICPTCKTEKPLLEFGKNKTKKDGLTTYCKPCSTKRLRELYNKPENKEKNKERNKINNKKYYEKWGSTPEYKEKQKKKWKKYYNENEEFRESQKEYLKKYRDSPEYRYKMKLYAREYRRKYFADPENKKKEKERKRKYYDNPENRKKLYEYVKKRREEDPLFKLSMNTRMLVYFAFKKKGYKKKSKTHKILGCSYEEFKSHLEKQFTEGMSWDNHGEWEMDHIIPIASAENEDEIIKLNHYTNFQPMWEAQNIRKSDDHNEEDKIKFLKSLEK